MKKLLLILSLTVVSVLLVSCDTTQVSCGEGTVLIDNVCVPATNNTTSQHTTMVETTLSTTETITTEDNSQNGNGCTMDITDYLIDGEEYEMVWSEEFDYEGRLDSTKWTYLIGNGHEYGIPGWGNGELQYYTDSLDNVFVHDGILTIKASTEGMNGYGYTSGRIVTKDNADFTYGIFEICAMMPTGLGTWPAIWMLPTDNVYGGWPYSGEIDIMEAVGFETDTVHWNIHTKAHNWGDNRSVGDHDTIENIATEFHRYGVKWLEDRIMFYVDGVHKFTYTPENLNDSNYWPFDQDFHLLLNIAVGGAWGGIQGIQTGDWETTMDVDYIRVYQEVTNS